MTDGLIRLTRNIPWLKLRLYPPATARCSLLLSGTVAAMAMFIILLLLLVIHPKVVVIPGRRLSRLCPDTALSMVTTLGSVSVRCLTTLRLLNIRPLVPVVLKRECVQALSIPLRQWSAGT